MKKTVIRLKEDGTQERQEQQIDPAEVAQIQRERAEFLAQINQEQQAAERKNEIYRQALNELVTNLSENQKEVVLERLF